MKTNNEIKKREKIKKLKMKFAKDLAKLEKPAYSIRITKHFIIEYYNSNVFPHKCEVDNTYKVGYLFKFDIFGMCVGI